MNKKKTDRKEEAKHELVEEALFALIDTIEATGGVTSISNPLPVGDTDWDDLGSAYLLACKALNREPRVNKDYCKESPSGKHDPDQMSIQRASGADWIIDIWCRHCRRSGSVSIDPNNIQW